MAWWSRREPDYKRIKDLGERERKTDQELLDVVIRLVSYTQEMERTRKENANGDK